VIQPPVPASGAEVALHYDTLDPFYREIWGEHLHHGLFDAEGPGDPQEAAARLLALVADRAGIRPGVDVCDVGCGYGATARVLAEDYGARVTGLTISEAQWRHGQVAAAHLEGVELHLRDWMANGLAESSFDAVVAIESFSHMPCPRRFFQEIARVLRPGGRFVVCAWLSAPEPGRLASRHLLQAICREGRLARLATVDEVRALVREAGLEMGAVEDLTRRVAPTWTVSAGRMAAGILTRRDYRRFLLRSGAGDRVFALTVFRIRLA
jgi:tocopherol O-methyltransferase